MPSIALTKHLRQLPGTYLVNGASIEGTIPPL